MESAEELLERERLCTVNSMRSGKQVPYLSPFQKDTVIRGGKKTEIICFPSENNKIIDAKKLAFHTSVK